MEVDQQTISPRAKTGGRGRRPRNPLPGLVYLRLAIPGGQPWWPSRCHLNYWQSRMLRLRLRSRPNPAPARRAKRHLLGMKQVNDHAHLTGRPLPGRSAFGTFGNCPALLFTTCWTTSVEHRCPCRTDRLSNPFLVGPTRAFTAKALHHLRIHLRMAVSVPTRALAAEHIRHSTYSKTAEIVPSI